MRVIGTAGHVDHGKSTLVEALTGIHPDRLKEEREREMTIDLGFAWFDLPNGEAVGIVDVPGHHDFIENMLAGVGGIDAALLVVAADEGVMPQTREHLAILDLLQIPDGVVALTKVDLVEDAEWLALVEDDVARLLAGTALSNAPIVRVSARTRQGLPELVAALSHCLAKQPPRLDLGRPRLPIDRVFTMAGFGTVVTGTLAAGSLRVGDEVVILPGEVRARIRGLQTHKQQQEIALPGSRTAVNLSGVSREQVQRGQVLCRPGDYNTTRRLDVHFRLLREVARPLQHNTAVKFFLGAAEVAGRVRLLGCEVLAPGESGWLQLELRQPVVATRDDRYILRCPSPGETLGGGSVVDPHPPGRHKRFAASVLERLETLSHGAPSEVLIHELASLGVAPLGDLLARSNLPAQAAQQALADLLVAGQVILVETPEAHHLPADPDTWLTSRPYWLDLQARVIGEVESYHRTYPLRRGMPREELKSRLRLPPRLFVALLRHLMAQGDLLEAANLVSRAGFAIRFDAQQQKKVTALLSRFAAARYAPPTAKECVADVGEELFAALIETGQLISLSPEVVFRQQDYEQMVGEVIRLIQQRGAVTAAEVRDHFDTSRRYALALLEHLDAVGVTVRQGDARRLKNPDASNAARQ